MASITIGKYMPLDSPIHRMDPRAKILAMLIMLISIMLPVGFIGYAILAAIIVGITLLAKLKLSFVINAMKPMLFMMGFLFVINILVIKTGNVLIDLWGFQIYDDAIYQTLYIVVRLVMMIMITTVLTTTTKPLELTLGIEDLLKPFSKIGLPAHEIAMMISIALRFIPTLIEETQRIMKAQASRGVDLEEGSIKERIAAILSLIVPLFVSAFQRAEDLANAMEARGYVPGERRTRYKQLVMKGQDYTLLIGSLVIFFAMVLLVIFI